eukprot:gene4884-3503_t
MGLVEDLLAAEQAIESWYRQSSAMLEANHESFMRQLRHVEKMITGEALEHTPSSSHSMLQESRLAQTPSGRAAFAGADDSLLSQLRGQGGTAPCISISLADDEDVSASFQSADPHFLIVQFKNRKLMYGSHFLARVGEYVVVGGDRGEDIGLVTDVYSERERALRRALPKEVQTLLGEQREAEDQAVTWAQAATRHQGLDMSIVDAEYQFDRRKLTFYYESALRPDFRNLIRELYQRFHARIWMEKAKGLGVVSRLPDWRLALLQTACVQGGRAQPTTIERDFKRWSAIGSEDAEGGGDQGLLGSLSLLPSDGGTSQRWRWRSVMNSGEPLSSESSLKTKQNKTNKHNNHNSSKPGFAGGSGADLTDFLLSCSLARFPLVGSNTNRISRSSRTTTGLYGFFRPHRSPAYSSQTVAITSMNPSADLDCVGAPGSVPPNPEPTGPLSSRRRSGSAAAGRRISKRTRHRKRRGANRKEDFVSSSDSASDSDSDSDSSSSGGGDEGSATSSGSSSTASGASTSSCSTRSSKRSNSLRRQRRRGHRRRLCRSSRVFSSSGSYSNSSVYSISSDSSDRRRRRRRSSSHRPSRSSRRSLFLEGSTNAGDAESAAAGAYQRIFHKECELQRMRLAIAEEKEALLRHLSRQYLPPAELVAAAAVVGGGSYSDALFDVHTARLLAPRVRPAAGGPLRVPGGPPTSTKPSERVSRLRPGRPSPRCAVGAHCPGEPGQAPASLQIASPSPGDESESESEKDVERMRQDAATPLRSPSLPPGPADDALSLPSAPSAEHQSSSSTSSPLGPQAAAPVTMPPLIPASTGQRHSLIPPSTGGQSSSVSVRSDTQRVVALQVVPVPPPPADPEPQPQPPQVVVVPGSSALADMAATPRTPASSQQPWAALNHYWPHGTQGGAPDPLCGVYNPPEPEDRTPSPLRQRYSLEAPRGIGIDAGPGLGWSTEPVRPSPSHEPVPPSDGGNEQREPTHIREEEQAAVGPADAGSTEAVAPPQEPIAEPARPYGHFSNMPLQLPDLPPADPSLRTTEEDDRCCVGACCGLCEDGCGCCGCCAVMRRFFQCLARCCCCCCQSDEEAEEEGVGVGTCLGRVWMTCVCHSTVGSPAVPQTVVEEALLVRTGGRTRVSFSLVAPETNGRGDIDIDLQLYSKGGQHEGVNGPQEPCNLLAGFLPAHAWATYHASSASSASPFSSCLSRGGFRFLYDVLSNFFFPETAMNAFYGHRNGVRAPWPIPYDHNQNSPLPSHIQPNRYSFLGPFFVISATALVVKQTKMSGYCGVILWWIHPGTTQQDFGSSLSSRIPIPAASQSVTF